MDEADSVTFCLAGHFHQTPGLTAPPFPVDSCDLWDICRANKVQESVKYALMRSIIVFSLGADALQCGLAKRNFA